MAPSRWTPLLCRAIDGRADANRVARAQAWRYRSPSQAHVVAPFAGGSFGANLRAQYQLVLAMMAALALERPAQLVLTRDQMLTQTYRPEAINRIGCAGSDQW